MEKIKLNYLNSPLVILTLVIGIFFSILLYSQISNNIEKTHTLEFQHLLKRQTEAVQKELDRNLLVLESIKSFFNSSNEVTRAEFKVFVDNSLRNLKSIQALEWIPRIKDKDRVFYETKASNELNLDFHIKEKKLDKMVVSKRKDTYFPVYYMEPLEGNEKALGFDLASNKTRLESLHEAKTKRKSTATSKITLVQGETKQAGFLMFVPIWNRLNKDILEGFALGVYKVEDMVKAALHSNQLDNNMIDIWLLDTTNKNDFELLYTNTENKKVITSNNFLNINIEGRVWTLYANPSKYLIEKNQTALPYYILTFGLLISFLLSHILSSKVSKTKELEELTNEKTKILRQSNRKYESLLEMFDKKVIASRTDLKGTITYATSAFAQISGYSKEELIGSSHSILRHPDMPRFLYEKLWGSITQGEIFTAEIKNKRKDGTSYWVNAIIMPEYDENRKICGYFAVRDDITDKKKVEELNNTLSQKVTTAVNENQKKDKLLLEQSKLAAMGEMIGAIAHQWRQPLNSLALKVQFIEDDFEDELIDEEYITKYSKENMDLINFMSKTIDDFRNFFTVDKEKTTFSVKNKIEDTINMIKAQLEAQQISLKIIGEDFYVLGFTSEFQQVILNLISNARDALNENNNINKEIFIELQQDNNTACVKISDNAGGIPEIVLNRIFEPYFTTKEQGKGTGLGLYMSKMIIEDNMHGKLNVSNNTDGAEFIIELKVSK